MSSAEASLPLRDGSSGSPDGAAAGAGAESPAAGRARAGPDADASPGDAALVREVQRGDEAAFETLVRRHLRAAHAAAFALTGDPDDADDICQDAFVSALEKIAQCRDPERFRAWLVTIVRNRAHDLRRRARSVELGTETVANDESPFQFADRSELRGRLAVALDTLTELQRRVLLLHDFEGWRHAEISAELGISHVASRFNLHVARRAMRARLKGTYGKE